MSPSDAGGRVRLTVEASDAATEIWLTLGQLETVAKGHGILLVDLPPGIYRVRARAGFDTQEQTVILQSGEREKSVSFPVLKFSSPAPLKNSAKAIPRHARAARAHSRIVHVEKGSDSWVFVFARDLVKRAGPTNPAQGLTLRSLGGDLIVDLAADSKFGDAGYPWAACNVSLDPGIYRLVLELSTGERFSQVLPSMLGWQTQVFLLQRTYGTNPDDCRADLAGAAILLAPLEPGSDTPGFRPDDGESRRAELARLGLFNNSTHFLEDVKRQLHIGDSFDPMLCIYCAHMLLGAGNPDLTLLKALVTDLRQRGLSKHPDIQALALYLELDRPSPPFTIPPMLRRSWELVLRTSIKRPEVVPLDCLAARAAESLWGEETWLLWRDPPSHPALEGAPSPFTELQQNLDEQLRRLPRTPTAATGGQTPLQAHGTSPSVVKTQFTQEWIERLVLALGIPRNRLEELLDRREDKEEKTTSKEQIRASGDEMRNMAGLESKGMANSIQSADTNAIEDILRKLATTGAAPPRKFFNYLINRAEWPELWAQSLADVWSGDVLVDAQMLVKFALARGTPANSNFTALGSLLYAVLTGTAVGNPDARTLAVMLVSFKLCFDEAVVNGLRRRFQMPETALGQVSPVPEIGPEIQWRGPDEIELQSWIRPQPDLQDVSFYKKLVARAASVCKIEDSLKQWHGTGFLIAPQLLVTNYHLLDPKRYGGASLDENARDIVLRFGCFSATEGDEAVGQTFKLHASKPILKASPTDKLDYVLLRVEDRIVRATGIEPAPFESCAPAVKAGLTILQHPQGQSMKVSISSDAVTGVYQESSRLQYVNRALVGSSGSPCFNDEWKVIALHHAERTRGFSTIREGILFSAILEQIQDVLN